MKIDKNESLIGMFQKLLDICYKDERTDNGDHYGIEYFEDKDLADEFKYELGSTLDYINRFEVKIYESFVKLVDCGLSYEVCLRDIIEVLKLLELQARETKLMFKYIKLWNDLRGRRIRMNMEEKFKQLAEELQLPIESLEEEWNKPEWKGGNFDDFAKEIRELKNIVDWTFN
jgi:hypothetical protein